MMKIADSYVSITGYLMQDIGINRQKVNIQPIMLAHPVFHDISIDTYKQEIFPTFMLANGVNITL